MGPCLPPSHSTTSCSSSATWSGRSAGTAATPAWPPSGVEEWRRGELPFPSLRIDDSTIIDLIPGLDDPAARGHLDHICLVVDGEHLAALAAELEVVDEGIRSGARGDARSIYVRDPDGLLVEFRTYDGM